ncbi:uncharacterized protein LOC133284513 [Gastrolobium bilobum]|uniref:uncharacterized protein LOC133284513 n=1 Tax=Gastrolobium bilobum TaxID=150636 RepID=UPI002AAFA2A4|nr:uncharacterized protein LOC133284513 [Gastrolobium bilobum]
MERCEPPRKRLQRKQFRGKFQREESSVEVFTKIRRGPRFGNFEATCDKDENLHPQEIIEFPSVIVSGVTGQIEACFRTYVRPTHNQILTDFCKDLTGIQQDQVDNGVTLDEALLMHDEWLETNGIKNSNFGVVTWSNCDCKVMLEFECKFKKIAKPAYFNQWINLRVPFRNVFGDMRCNLKNAVEIAGLEQEDRAHSGLDDAKNTVRLLALIMHKGYRFSITNYLPCKQYEEHARAFSECQYKLKGMMITPMVVSLYFHCGVTLWLCSIQVLNFDYDDLP